MNVNISKTLRAIGKNVKLLVLCDQGILTRFASTRTTSAVELLFDMLRTSVLRTSDIYLSDDYQDEFLTVPLRRTSSTIVYI